MDSLGVKLEIWKSIVFEYRDTDGNAIDPEAAGEKAKKVFETLANKNPSEVAQR